MKAISVQQSNAVSGEICPVCSAKSLTLSELEQDVPFFGRVYVFSMSCGSCRFRKSDVECSEKREPARYSIDVSGPDDMGIRVVKSSNGIVRVPHIASIEPGEASDGYVTNIEGILQRIKQQVESVRDSEEDAEAVRKSRKLVKKINRVIRGEDKARIIIEDASGNSAIVSDKTVVQKLKA